QAQRDQLISSALDKLFDGDVSGGSSSSSGVKGEKKEEGAAAGVKQEGEGDHEQGADDKDTAVAEAVFKGDLEWERIEVISDDEEGEGGSTEGNKTKSTSSVKDSSSSPPPPPVHIADEVEAAAAKRKAAMPHMVFKAKKKARATPAAE
ncbi:Coiled-coil domain-containing protein 94, partial [Perkinsus olseni]